MCVQLCIIILANQDSVRNVSALLLALPAILLPGSSALRAQQSPTIYDRPLSERRVSYDIVAQLNPDKNSVSAVERITWRNPGPVPVSELQFHLYLNAFSGPKTTFMSEGGDKHRGFSSNEADRWGGVKINRMVIAADPPLPHGDFNAIPSPMPGPPAGIDITDSIEFIRPDDGNEDDFTVITVQLPEPVAPGETIAPNVDFTSKLPRVTARTGWTEKRNGTKFFFVGQWFPKLGVYEVPGQRYVPADAEEGRWNTHQFHLNSEWYSDFGTYRVQMTVPSDYTLGASGVRIAEESTDSTTTYTYVADDVHDFAWTASQDYLEFYDRWKHVEIRLLIQPEHEGQVRRHFEAAKTGLQYFDDWYGEYPYTTLTLVDGIGGSNGMEYPTLITCGTFYGLPDRFRILELVTIHEFGHQYWYGLLASNEFEESWLDEGINSYTEMRIMDDAYGFGSAIGFPGFEINGSDFQRLGYTKNRPTRGAIYTHSWKHDFNDYGKVSYSKPAMVLGTLEGYIGTERMRKLMRTYYTRWRFRHPTTRDFIDVANEIAGQDLSWFFDQFIYGTVAVDYTVAGVSSKRIDRSTQGDPDGGDMQDRKDGSGDLEEQSGNESRKMYLSKVVLQRKQNGIMPVDVMVRFENGETESFVWDDGDEWKKIEYERPDRVAEVYIDPENKVLLDLNKLNNRWVREADSSVSTKYGLKYLVWVQQFLQAFTGFL